MVYDLAEKVIDTRTMGRRDQVSLAERLKANGGVLVPVKKMKEKKRYPHCGPGILRSDQFTAKFLLDMYKFIFEGSFECTKKVDNCMFNREYCNELKQCSQATKKEKETEEETGKTVKA